jgi:hypothetical protein
MLKRAIAISAGIMILTALYIGCGGGPKIALPEGGIQLTYNPAVGKSFNYRTIVQKYVRQSAEGGATVDILFKGDVRFAIAFLEAGKFGEAKMKYTFKEMNVGRFVNNQIQNSDDLDEFKDLEITAWLDTAGSLDSIDGYEPEENMEKATKQLSPTEFLLSFPIPHEKVTMNYSWHKESDTTISTEDGSTKRKVVVDYKAIDFVEIGTAKCVVFELKGKSTRATPAQANRTAKPTMYRSHKKATSRAKYISTTKTASSSARKTTT